MILSDEARDKLRALASQVAEREGLKLYDLETPAGRQRLIRVYVDREVGAVSVDDCANVSRGLNLLLDVEDLVPGGAYELEVSSPGLERRLSEKWHFERAVTKRIRVKVATPKRWTRDGQEFGASLQTVEGILESVQFEGTNEDHLELRDDNRVCKLPWADVVRGQIVFRPEPNEKRGK
jgi:ribosome maturation factor RimP